MNRLQTLINMCIGSRWVSSFSYMPEQRIFSCMLNEDYDNQHFVFSFNETLTSVNEWNIEIYEELLFILKGWC